MHGSSRKGFTLIELLVVIAIIAILAVVVVLTLNPAELLRQSRDANRVSDMATLMNALNLYNTDQGGSQSYSLGSASTAYVSIPDPTATSTAGDQCQGLGMPSLPSGSYHCSPASSYRNMNGTGWIPVNFSAISSGSPFGSLPVDPTNQTSSNLFYTYQTNGTQFETTAVMESQKYQSLASSSGGPYSNLYVKGSNLSLALTDYASAVATVASGTVTQANMKLSLVNGTAFVDFSASNALTPYAGDSLTICSVTNPTQCASGYIKSAGTGETYGSQLFGNTTFATTTGLSSGGGTITPVSSGCYSNSGSGPCLKITLSSSQAYVTEGTAAVSEGALLRFSLYGKNASTSYLSLSQQEAYSPYSGIGVSNYFGSSWGQEVNYFTADTSGNEFNWNTYAGGASTDVAYVDTLSGVVVLTPSSFGVTIVSTSGGSTYDWATNTMTQPNDPNGYTYSIVL